MSIHPFETPPIEQVPPLACVVGDTAQERQLRELQVQPMPTMAPVLNADDDDAVEEPSAADTPTAEVLVAIDGAVVNGDNVNDVTVVGAAVPEPGAT